MLDVDKQTARENPKHGVFSPHSQFKTCDTSTDFYAN